MSVQRVGINNAGTKPKIKMNPVSVTGYGALGLGTLSVVSAANKKVKSHKYLGYLAGALAFIHTGIILGGRMACQNTPLKTAVKVQDG